MLMSVKYFFFHLSKALPFIQNSIISEVWQLNDLFSQHTLFLGKRSGHSPEVKRTWIAFSLLSTAEWNRGALSLWLPLSQKYVFHICTDVGTSKPSLTESTPVDQGVKTNFKKSDLCC